MRVISGKVRGLKLRAAEGLATRPTADRIKESLFNMLAPNLYDCKFLDLFSGTGAIGIEALSRGARSAVFVDNSAVAVKTIKANLKAAKFSDSALVLHMDFIPATKLLSGKESKFDIVFMDPPYHLDLVPQAAAAADGLMADGGIIVAELESGGKIQVDGFEIYKRKDYRASSVIFLQKVRV